MAANSSFVLTQLDFDSNKALLKEYLREQSEFKDYDFEDSNMSVMLDILSYNTYLNAFYLNMIGNEMFLDSASLRDSVVSHAKELNYIPRSFTSASAKVDFIINSTDPTLKSIVIPRGTAVISRVGDKTYTFTTDDIVTATSSTGQFIAENVDIYEGIFQSDTYAVNYENNTKFIISNKRVDVSSISVTVIEDNGATQINYLRATSLFGYDSTSEIFFIQPCSGETYEVIFGDGVIGRKPKNNSVVLIEYRVSNGELPNGAQKFIFTGKINGQADVTVRTVSAAIGGAVSETLDSIKYNAPRAFTTQERAVTSEDYENLLKSYYPEINAVTAYGGEDLNPPQYGKVMVCIDLVDINGLPDIKKDEYTRFLKSRSFTTMEPVFVSPEYTYLSIDTNIKYNVNITTKTPEDIRTIVLSYILQYSNEKLNNFNRALRYSRLTNFIDTSDSSIISNETDIKLIKYITPKLNLTQNIDLSFKMPLSDTIPIKDDVYESDDISTITSSKFVYNGQMNCTIQDDGEGNLMIVNSSGRTTKKIVDIGTVNYLTGEIRIKDFYISSFTGASLKIFATPKNKDILSSENIILGILEPDINITIEQIRE